MAREPDKTTKSGLTPAGMRAWGMALVKTGTEHLDLSMVLDGKEILAKGTTPAPGIPPKSKFPPAA